MIPVISKGVNMKKKLTVILVMILLVSGFINVNSGNAMRGFHPGTYHAKAAAVSSIKVSGPKEVSRGNTAAFKAVITPEAAAGAQIKWSVNVDGKKTGYASITQNGKVTVSKDAPIGTVITVKATAQDGSKVSGTLKFTVTRAVKSVILQNKNGEAITGKKISVNLGRATSYQIHAVSEPASASDGFTWKSSDKKVATVDSKGFVTFLGNGTVSITATARDGSGQSASVTFNLITRVTKIELSGLGNVNAGESITIKAKVSPSSATNKKIEWSVVLNGKKSNLVSVSNGVVTVNSKVPVGSVITVTASATDKSGIQSSGEIKVTGPVPAASIQIDGPGSVEAGGSVKLTAVVSPGNATNKKVKWSVVLNGKKSSLVTVSHGTVTVDKKVSGGSVVTVTAAAADGSGVKASAKLKVNGPVLVSSITLENAGAVRIGSSRTLKATVEPANADNKDIKWSVVLDGAKSDLVSIKNGRVTVSEKAPVNSVITVTAKAADGSGVKAQAKLTVKDQIKVTSIRIEGAGAVRAGDSKTVTAVVEPDNAANKEVTWSVTLDGNKSSLVSVKGGKISVDRMVSGGSVITVTAKAADGSGVKGQAKLTVKGPVYVSAIKIDNVGSVAPGKTRTLSAVVEPANADNKNVKWSVLLDGKSSDLVTIDNGKVSVGKRAPDRSVITVTASATDGSGVKDTVKFHVKEPVMVTSIKISAPGSIKAGESGNISAKVEPSNAENKKVRWSILLNGKKTDLAQISDGKITVNKKAPAGSVLTVTAAAADGSDVSDRKKIRIVSSHPVESIKLTGPDITARGVSLNISAEVSPENAENKSLSWSIDQDRDEASSVGISQNGTVTVPENISLGTILTVTAAAKDGSGVSASKNIRVVRTAQSVAILDAMDHNITWQTLSVRMNESSEMQLKAKVYPEDEFHSVTWSSSDKNVASVNRNGKVTFKAGGNVTITATSMDGSGAYASVYLNGTAYISQIRLSADETIPPGGSRTITAKITPSNASNKKLRWYVLLNGQPTRMASIQDGQLRLDYGAPIGSILTVIAEAEDGSGVRGQTDISVVQWTPVSDITIKGPESIAQGYSVRLRASVTPSDATNKTMKWSLIPNDAYGRNIEISSKGAVTVPADTPAGTTFTVTAAPVDEPYTYAQKLIRVTTPTQYVSILSENGTNLTGGFYNINLNDSYALELRAGIWPTGCSTEVSWTSSDTDIAAVTKNGKVTFKKNGTVMITATATDGTKISSSVTLTGTVLVSEIRVHGSETIYPGSSAESTPDVLPANVMNGS